MESDRESGGRPEPPAGPNPWRYAGMGTELVAGIAGCILVGYWVDSKCGTGRVGVIVGATVGCVGGFYHFLTQAVRMEREAEKARKHQKKMDRRDDE